MAYKVAGIDNRGSTDCPFGFIYLAEGKNLAGRIGFGAHRENPDPLAIWPCRETPNNISPLAIIRVREALAQAFPHLTKKED